MKKILLLPIFLFGVITIGKSQPTEEDLDKVSVYDKFEAASTLMENKQYYQALRIWQNILKTHPDNANYNYKAGICQLEVITGRNNAIDYLKKTIGKVAKNYDPNDPDESKVPIDGLYYLARAYHLDNQYDKAIETFNQFKTESSTKHYLRKDIERQIAFAENAKKEVADKKTSIKIFNIGGTINSAYEDFSPVVSLDENVLYFTSRRLRPDSTNKDYRVPADGKFYEDVYVSYRDRDGNWMVPQRVKFDGEDVSDNEATISVSADGSRVYVYHDDAGDGNIYTAKALDTSYSELEKMTGEINTNSWETHCTMTPDGSVIYFVSDRPGGVGGRDIYRVKMLPNGQWSKALPLPPPINTIYDEDAPFIHPAGNLLYFSSNGMNSMGGFDIFFSRLDEEGNFSTPVNMGYPINSVDDDVFFVTNASGKRAYYSSSHEGGYGEKDIYIVELDVEQAEPFAILKGYIRVPEGEKLPEDIVIYVSDLTVGGDPQEYRPRNQDGGFVMSLTPCHEYLIDYHIGGSSYAQDQYLVPCESDYQEFSKELFLSPLSLDGNNPEDSTLVSDLKWQLLFNKLPTLQKDIVANYLDEKGNILFSEQVDEKGRFPHHKLPSGIPYIFEIKSPDANLCDKLEVVLLDENQKEIGVTKRDERCRYTYNKIPQNPIDNPPLNNNDPNNVLTKPAYYEKYYTYNARDIEKSEAMFNKFIEDAAAIAKAKGFVEISIEGSASKVPTTTFKTNDRLSRFRTNDAKTRLMEKLVEKGIDPKKVRFKSINSLVQGPRYNNDFMENKASYEKYQYIKMWAK